MEQARLDAIVAKHLQWLRGEDGGKRANLRDADLRDADLRGADLRDANLRDADLCGADLRDANLRGADLRDADLCDANLRDADLRGANVSSVRHRRLLSIGPIGSRNAMLVYDADADVAYAGCQHLPLADLLARVEAVYPEGSQHRAGYLLAIEWIMRSLALEVTL